MNDQELTNELTVTACAVSVTAALEALDIAANQMRGLACAALARGNDQAYAEYERLQGAYQRAADSLSNALAVTR